MARISLLMERSLTAIAVVFGIVLIIIFARRNIRGFENAILEETEASMQQTVRVTTFLLENMLNDIVHASTDMNSRHRMMSAFLNKKGESFGDVEKDVFLVDFYEGHKELISRISLFDGQGNKLGSYPQGGQIISEQEYGAMIKDEQGRWIVAFAVPSGFESEDSWKLVAEVSVYKLNAMVQGLGDRKGRELFLLNDQGRIVSHPEHAHLGINKLVMHQNEFPQHKNCELEEYFLAMSRGEAGAGVYRSLRQEEGGMKVFRVILAYHPVLLADKTWSVGLKVDYDQVIEPVKDYSRNIFLVTEFLIIMIIAGGTALYKFRKKKDELEISTRSAQELAEANSRLTKEVNERRKTQEALRKSNDELQQAQAQILQAEKMAVIGQLSAGVAHEIKNPLAIILLSIQALKEKLKGMDAENKQYADMIQSAAERANKVVIELLNFSRGSAVQLKRNKVHELLNGTVSLLENSVTKLKNIEIIKDFQAPKGVEVEADGILLQQVFFNLMNNAADAITDKGTITLSTKVLKGEEKVAVEISDDGPGISKEILRRIFDPFFTTKDPGKGTGLGLSTVFMILEKHNGNITASSEEGKGTVFVITLPCFKEESS